MITAIREIRKARGLTLDDVAKRCVPPTTAQQVGRLELGTRSVSIAWLNRLAGALDVSPAELVKLPNRADLPVAATLDAQGAHAPRKPMVVMPPTPASAQVAVTVSAGVGDYRAGDVLWCVRLAPDSFGEAMNRDVLVPRPGGRFAFGRLIGRDGARLHLLPPGHGARQHVVADAAWLAHVATLVRSL